LTQPKTLQNVAYARFAPNCRGSVKIGKLGQKRIGANNTALNSVKIALKKPTKWKILDAD